MCDFARFLVPSLRCKSIPSEGSMTVLSDSYPTTGERLFLLAYPFIFISTSSSTPFLFLPNVFVSKLNIFKLELYTMQLWRRRRGADLSYMHHINVMKMLYITTRLHSLMSTLCVCVFTCCACVSMCVVRVCVGFLEASMVCSPMYLCM